MNILAVKVISCPRYVASRFDQVGIMVLAVWLVKPIRLDFYVSANKLHCNFVLSNQLCRLRYSFYKLLANIMMVIGVLILVIFTLQWFIIYPFRWHFMVYFCFIMLHEICLVHSIQCGNFSRWNQSSFFHSGKVLFWLFLNRLI